MIIKLAEFVGLPFFVIGYLTEILIISPFDYGRQKFQGQVMFQHLNDMASENDQSLEEYLDDIVDNKSADKTYEVTSKESKKDVDE